MSKNISNPQSVCTNTFIESDGFCNACGKRHYNPRKDASKQRLAGSKDAVSIKPALKRVVGKSSDGKVFAEYEFIAEKELSNEKK